MKIKKPGLRASINAKCKDCIYDNLGEGNWRQQVSACTSEDCPLYAVRPISSPKRAKLAVIQTMDERLGA